MVVGGSDRGHNLVHRHGLTFCTKCGFSDHHRGQTGHGLTRECTGQANTFRRENLRRLQVQGLAPKGYKVWPDGTPVVALRKRKQEADQVEQPDIVLQAPAGPQAPRLLPALEAQRERLRIAQLLTAKPK